MDANEIRALAKEIYGSTAQLKHDFDEPHPDRDAEWEECKLCGLDEMAEDADGICEVALIELIINVILKAKDKKFLW